MEPGLACRMDRKGEFEKRGARGPRRAGLAADRHQVDRKQGAGDRGNGF